MSIISRFLLFSDAVLEVSFILVHERISAVEYLGYFMILTGLERRHSDSNYRAFTGSKILVHLLHKSRCQSLAVSVIIASYEHRELIASDTEYRTVIEYIANKFTCCFKKIISCFMAEIIVVLLQSVDITHRDRERQIINAVVDIALYRTDELR